MAGKNSKPHDHLFRSVFEEESEAAGLLRAHLPQAVSRELEWSSLKLQRVSFIDDRLRDSESDLLFAVGRKADGAPAWLYVLLEHQSTPDHWLRLRLRDRRRHPQERHLRLIVPLVLYQGRRRWRPACEFSELFAAELRNWPGVPRYAHLLIDQTKAGPDELHGELRGRIAQLAMMAAYRTSWPLLQRLVPLLAELAEAGDSEDLSRFTVYIATTTRNRQRWHRFAEAVRRQVPGGEELVNKTQEMIDIYGEVREQEGREEGRQEGRREGELRGRLLTIEGLLGRAVPWSVIEAATGIDEATFRRHKQRSDAAADNGAD